VRWFSNESPWKADLNQYGDDDAVACIPLGKLEVPSKSSWYTVRTLPNTNTYVVPFLFFL